MALYKFERLCQVSLTVITNKKQMCSMHSCYHQYSMCIYSQDYLQLTSCLTSRGIDFKKEKKTKCAFLYEYRVRRRNRIAGYVAKNESTTMVINKASGNGEEIKFIWFCSVRPLYNLVPMF